MPDSFKNLEQDITRFVVVACPSTCAHRELILVVKIFRFVAGSCQDSYETMRQNNSSQLRKSTKQLGEL